MFSLCIATMDRFDSFLKEFLEKYLTFELIDEIIITDEDGNDYEKITNYFQNTKIKCYKNDKRLGCFMNKLKCCKLAKNEWIVLMDSDNFADTDYFLKAKEYIEVNNPSNNSILAPDFAKPIFNYKHLSNMILKKETKNTIFKHDQISSKKYDLKTLMNTGNYVINKFLIENLDISSETKNIQFSNTSDVIYFNTLLFEQLNMNFHIVKDMEYIHNVHNGSIYIKENRQFTNFNKYIYKRFNMF